MEQVLFRIRFNDITPLEHFCTGYSKTSQICSGTTSLEIDFSPNISHALTPGNRLVLYEYNINTDSYYKDKEYFVTSVSRNSNGGITANCQDGSKYLQDYFIDDVMVTERGKVARYWVEQILQKTGIGLVWNAKNNGILVDAEVSLGMQSAYDSLTTLCQQNGWYFYMNSNNQIVVGSIDFSPTDYKFTLNNSNIIGFSINKNDEMLRNRAVVWGGTDWDTRKQIFKDEVRPTPWDRDSKDRRAVVIANGMIGNQSVANAMSKQVLDEFSRITVVKTIEIDGMSTVNPQVGDGFRVNHRLWNGVGMATTIQTTASPSEGFKRTIILDERCPRLFAYFKTWDFPFLFPDEPLGPVYLPDEPMFIGTDQHGVWFKAIDNSVGWTEYNEGLGRVGIKDLHVFAGMLVCVTYEGRAFTRMFGDPVWTLFTPTGFIDASDGTRYNWNQLEAIACVINQATNEIYIGYNLVEKRRAWVASIRPDGTSVNRQLTTPDGEETEYRYTIVDIETNMADVLALVDKGEEPFELQPTISYGAISPVYGDKFQDSSFSGEWTLVGIDDMVSRPFDSSAGTRFNFDGLYAYGMNSRLNILTGITGYSQSAEHESDGYTPYLNRLLPKTLSPNTTFGWDLTQDNSNDFGTLGWFSSPQTYIADKFYTLNRDTTSAFEPAGYSGPVVVKSDDGTIRVCLFVTIWDGLHDYPRRIDNYIWNVQERTLTVQEDIIDFPSGFAEDDGVTQLPLFFDNFPPTTSGPDGVYTVNLHTTTFESIPFGIVAKIDKNTGEFSYVDRTTQIGSLPFVESGSLSCSTAYDPETDSFILYKSGQTPVYKLDRSSSNISHIYNHSVPIVLPHSIWNKNTALVFDPITNCVLKLNDGSQYYDLSTINSGSDSIVLALDHNDNDKFYVLKPKDEEDGEYFIPVYWIDKDSNTGDFRIVVPDSTPEYSGLFHLIGNVLIGGTGNRIFYPNPDKYLKRQILKTNPETGFELVFTANRNARLDNLVKIESSKGWPSFTFGSMTEITDDGEIAPNEDVGIMYIWADNILNTWTPQPIPGLGIIDDLRVFDTITNSEYDVERKIIFTQRDGSVMVRSAEVYLPTPTVLVNLSDPVTAVETNNFSSTPHYFASTFDGSVTRFHQQLNNETSFTEFSTGIPQSRVNVIRVDDLI